MGWVGYVNIDISLLTSIETPEFWYLDTCLHSFDLSLLDTILSSLKTKQNIQ